MKENQIIASVFLILIITFIAFYPSLNNNFVNWDDNVLVTENIKIKSLSWENIKSIFTSFYVGTYIPLTTLSYSFEYYFLKLNPRVYHTTNLILHLLNSILVFWLIFILGGKVFTALVVAILFGIHPLRVESVAWVTTRKDLLYTLFFLSSISFYIYYQKNKSVKYYYLSLMTFILSLLSKPMAITFPFVLLLHDYLVGRKFSKNIIMEKIPFLGMSVLFSIIAIFAQHSFVNIKSGKLFMVFNNVLNASYAIVFYLTKILAPIKLSCVYPLPDKTETIFIFSPVIVFILLAGVIISSNYTRKIVFGSLFFLITILPVLQLIPLASPAIVADRYTYIPLIGLFYIVGEGFSWLYLKETKYARLIKIFLLTILVGTTATLSSMVWQRCKVWKDSITLWTDALKNYPNMSIAYNNRGEAYFRKRDYERAISNYNQAIKINPNYAGAYNNRGLVYCNKGEFDKAIFDYTHAIKINPNFAFAYSNRGRIHFHKGEYNKAISDYTHAIKINPGYIRAYENRAIAYLMKEKYDKAWEDVYKVQKSGYKISPRFLEKLHKFSGRQQ